MLRIVTVFLISSLTILFIIGCSSDNNPVGPGPVFPVPWNVCISGNTAFIAYGYAGLEIVDMTNASNPELVYSDMTYPRVKGAALHDNELYLVTKDTIEILDVSDIHNPVTISSCAHNSCNTYTMLMPPDFFSYPNLVIPFAPFRIFDVSNSSNPELKSSLNIQDSTTEIFCCSSKIYAAHPSSGICEIDISDPSNPLVFPIYPINSATIQILDNFAFIMHDDSSNSLIDVLDVSDRSNVTLIGQYSSSQKIEAFLVTPDYIYLAERDDTESSARLCVLDSSDLTDIHKIHSCDYQSHHYLGIVKYGSRIYAHGGSGLDIYDASDPHHPELIGSYRTPNRMIYLD